MHLKIYFQSKPLYLCDQVSGELDDYLHRGDAIFMDELSPSGIRTMIYEMEQPDFNAGIFLHPNLEELLDAFKKYLKPVLAGGGFVYTEDQKVLIIKRRGKWDLPKGKLDEGEEISACAVREVQEETGLEAVQLGAPLCITYHTYHERGEHILKESHWYLMQAREALLTPQADEDIEECRWVPVTELDTFLTNTHQSILDVVRAGVQQLKQTARV